METKTTTLPQRSNQKSISSSQLFRMSLGGGGGHVVTAFKPSPDAGEIVQVDAM